MAAGLLLFVVIAAVFVIVKQQHVSISNQF